MLLVLLALLSLNKAYCRSNSDSLIKRKSDEKFMNLASVRFPDNFNNVVLYELANDFTSLRETDRLQASTGRDNDKKRQMFYLRLNSLSEKEALFTKPLYKTLKLSGYVDTVNKYFADRINLIYLSAEIELLNIYTWGKKKSGPSLRTKMHVKWDLRNNFNETISTIHSSGLSSEVNTEGANVLNYLENDPDVADRMLKEAFDNSYLDLRRDTAFIRALRFINDYTISEPILALNQPAAFVSSRSNAGEASVMVRTATYHGSGFAITTDGYIITSFGAIDEAVTKKDSTVQVVTFTGNKFDARIIRYNRYRNVALLKINAPFERAFKLPAEKTYKNLGTVYAIGSPKSIELEQSMSTGIISSDRKVNNNHFIQLNMSINEGNSGSPLFNETGELYGMLVAKLAGWSSEGVSFALPAFLLEHHLQLKFK